MSRWALLLGGLSIWAAHFFLLYAFASIFPGNELALWLTIAATCAALAANAAILWLAVAARLGGRRDGLDQWLWRLAFTGAALSFVAVLWQGLPAVI